MLRCDADQIFSIQWDQGEKFPSADQCVKLPAGAV